MNLAAGDGSSLGYLEQSGRQRTVVLADGRQLHLKLRWFGQGWFLIDDNGSEVLWSVRRAVSDRTREQLETGRLPESSPSINGYRFHVETFVTAGPDDWLVTPDGSLDLAQIIAVVEGHRTLVKATRNHQSPP